MDLREFLRLQTMYEADGGTNGGEEPPEGSEEETPEDEDEEETTEGSEKNADEKTFTQAELDQIIAERLARKDKQAEDAVKAAEAKAEAERLKEEGKYKELYETVVKQLDEQKAATLATKKESLLTKAGYKDEQVELFVSLLSGETDEELQESLDRLVAATPPAKKYADPSAGNGRRTEPDKKGGDEVGKTAYDRLKSLGKIRRK